MNIKTKDNIARIIATVVFSMLIGALLILVINENPLTVIKELFNGAYGSKLRVGTTIANLTPILLTSTAFAVAAKTGVFNVGVEGCVFLGALGAAYVGINWTFLPAPILIATCFAVAIIIGALWSFIPAYLKVAYNVNEVTVTILMNTVAFYITSYFVSGPMSGGGAVAQSHPVQVSLPKILPPSKANAGLFIAIAVIILIHFVLSKTKFGYKVTATGSNYINAEYAGLKPSWVIIQAMMLSGMVAGIAGCIEVLGVHGVFLNNFAAGLGTDGMLISLISGNNLLVIPFISLFIATLNAGGMGIQITTNVPKSMIDTFVVIIILFASMETLGPRITGKLKSMSNRANQEV